MKLFYRLLGFLSVLLCINTTVVAHEFLLKPEKWTLYKENQQLPLSVYSTHVFIKGEEIEDTSKVEVSYAGEKVNLTPNQAWLTQDGRVTLKGEEAAIIEGHRLPMLWSETPKGGVDGGRSINKDAITVRSYEKFAKLLLPVDGHTDNFYKVVGQRLEIVPVTNPLTAKIGDELKFKVLLDGKLAAFETIQATYDNFTDIPSAWAYSAAPIQHGEAIVKISAAGLWIVKVNVTLPNKTAEYDEEILGAALIFPVQ